MQSAALNTLAKLERLTSRTVPDLAAQRNFLLLQYSTALGTAIHATPLISAMHTAIPGARIAAAASGFSYDILTNNPGLEQLVLTPSPLTHFTAAVRALRNATFFNGEPYIVLQTAGNRRSIIAITAMLAGQHTRVGHTVVPQLSAAPVILDKSFSQIANNLWVTDALGHGEALHTALSANPNLIEPQVFPSPADQTAATVLLLEQGIDLTLPIAIFVTQTSPTQRKSWPQGRFRAVAESLHTRHAMQILFVGAPNESAAIDTLRSGLSFPTVNVAGRTTLLQLAALMAHADLAITLDTGPMHLLRAMRVPMVIIAPAWSPPIEWLPLDNPRARILKNATHTHAAPDYVIDEVSSAEVESAASDLLRDFPPSPAQRATRLRPL